MDGHTDGQNYNPQDCASIAALCSKNQPFDRGEWQGSNGIDEQFNSFSTVNTLERKSPNTSVLSIFVLTVIGLHTSTLFKSPILQGGAE